MTFSRGHLEQEADRDESFVPDFPPFFAAVSEMFFASWQKISGADGLQVKRLHLSPIMFSFNSISFRPGHFWKTKHPLNILSSELTMNSKLKTKVWKIRAEVLLWNYQPWLSIGQGLILQMSLNLEFWAIGILASNQNYPVLILEIFWVLFFAAAAGVCFVYFEDVKKLTLCSKKLLRFLNPRVLNHCGCYIVPNCFQMSATLHDFLIQSFEETLGSVQNSALQKSERAYSLSVSKCKQAKN